MSILDTFYLLFETNAEKISAETAKAETASQSLVGTLGKDAEAGGKVGEELRKSGEKGTIAFQDLERVAHRFFLDTIKQIAELGTSFLGFLAVEHLFDKALETSEMVEQLGNTAKALNVNVSDLDAWGQAVVKAGGTAEGFQQSIRALNEHIAGIEVGGRGKEFLKFFHSIGVEALDAHGKMKPVFELLPQLADALHKLPANQATAIGQRLGLDQGTLQLLERGKAGTLEMVAAARALGVVNQEDVETNEKFQAALKDTTEMFRGVFIEVNDYVLPVLTAFLEGLDEVVAYLTEHKDLIEGFFIGIAAAVTTYYGPAMAATAIETMIAIAPLLLIIGTILLLSAAFAFAYDDVMNFLAGNNSVIGELSKKWPLIGETIKAVAKVIGEAIHNPKKLWNDFINGLVAAFKWFEGEVEGTINNIIKAIDRLIGKLAEIHLPGFGTVGAAVSPVVNAVTGAVTGTAAAVSKLVAGHVTATGVALPPGVGAGLSDQQGAAAAYMAALNGPMAGQTSASVTAGGQKANTINNNTTIGDTTVTTSATDPKAVAKAVGDTLSGHIQKAINHYSDGTQS